MTLKLLYGLSTAVPALELELDFSMAIEDAADESAAVAGRLCSDLVSVVLLEEEDWVVAGRVWASLYRLGA